MTNPSYAQVKNLTSRDYYQFVTSILMTVVGTIILFRTLFSHFSVLPILLGTGFLFLGVYRLSFAYRYLRKREK